MRTFLLAGIVGLLVGVSANAEPAQPVVMTASATMRGPVCTLHIRPPQITPATIESRSKMPVAETSVGPRGRIIERVRHMEIRRQEEVFKPVPGMPIDVVLDGVDVGVFDVNGKPVPPGRVKNMLHKETPVLVSFNGPVDRYYLQTTRADTLIIQLPAQLFTTPNGPTEVLPPARDPGEPPLAKPRP